METAKKKDGKVVWKRRVQDPIFLHFNWDKRLGLNY